MYNDYLSVGKKDDSYYGNGWGKFNTPLSEYAYGPLARPQDGGYASTFGEYAREMARLHPNPMFVDVGVGSLLWWPSFLQKNPNVQFKGITLTPKTVAPEHRDLLVRSLAGDIWRHFDQSSIDLIATHWGAYRQTLSLIENAVHLLKINGDLVISQMINCRKLPDMMKMLAQFDGILFRILSSDGRNVFERWSENAGTYYQHTLHLRKIAEP